jgi:hypothetical protein
MKLKVKTIIIITKKHDSALVGMTRQVTEWLLQMSSGKKDPYTMYPYPYPNHIMLPLLTMVIVMWTRILKTQGNSNIKLSLNSTRDISTALNSGLLRFVFDNLIYSTLSSLYQLPSNLSSSLCVIYSRFDS